MAAEGFTITDIHAFVSRDENGVEGLCAWHTGMGWMPLVAADRERVDSLRPYAAIIATQTGRPIQLVRFSVREELGTIGPAPEDENSPR